MTRIKSIGFPNSEGEMSAVFDKLQRSTVNELLVSGALAISAGSSALAKFASTIYFMIDGQLYSKTTANCAAFAGTVTAAKFNVFVFSVNAAGTLATQMGTEAATLGGVVFPAVADSYVAIGFVIVNPTGTGNFVGGSTQLDDATVIPNAVYINTVGDFFPQYATL
jgi:hypothetical protein